MIAFRSTARSSPDNLEPPKSVRRQLRIANSDLFDVTFQFAFRDGGEKCADLFGFAGRLQFHAPVVEISNPTRDVKSPRDLFDGESKSDSLHPAFVKNLFRDHDSEAAISRR